MGISGKMNLSEQELSASYSSASTLHFYSAVKLMNLLSVQLLQLTFLSHENCVKTVSMLTSLKVDRE